MEIRKVQEIGGTYMISLPKKWAESLGIRRGSTLAIELSKEGALIIYPSKKERWTKCMEISYPTTSKQLFDEIVTAYLSGYEVIKVVGKTKIGHEDRNIVRDVARKFIGLEIVEEDSMSITIQFLLQMSSLKPKKLFIRMHTMTKGMYLDAINSIVEKDSELARVVIERDDEVDRLYFLLIRLLRSVALDPSLGMEVGLSTIECLDYRVASSILEKIGDISVQLSRFQDMEIKDADILKRIAEELNIMQEKVVDSFLKRDRKEAEKIFDISERINNSIAESKRVNGGFELHELLKEITKGLMDIADLIVPV